MIFSARRARCLAFCSAAVMAVARNAPADDTVFPTDFCAEEIHRSEMIPAPLFPVDEAPAPRVSFLDDVAVILEYPSVYDVHTALDPSLPIRSQPGVFLEQTILEDLEPYVDESVYDFVLMYSLQELPGWINAGNRWNGAPAKNIGHLNGDYGNGKRIPDWPRLRGTPHMNLLDLYDGWELFPGSDAGTLIPIHEMGHYWMVHWSNNSPGPVAWRPGHPIAHLAGARYHWSWNWVDTVPGPEDMPGIMYSAPLSYTFNEFDLYAMGLMAYDELAGVEHAIYECAPPNYSACNPGDEHELRIEHLVESLELAGPAYFEGDGLRIPAIDPTAQEINVLLVVVKGADETLTEAQEHLMRTIGSELPGAWSTATQGRSQLSAQLRPAGVVINPGLNDAWFNDATPGQGFFIMVFEDAGSVFLGWFTFDTVRPPPEVIALLGEPGHRWVTAQGPYAGDTAVLDVYVTEDGVFDSNDPPAETGEDPIGAITIQWRDCEQATLTYEIDPPGVAGEIPLRRVVPDNVALCEALGTP